jgi:hypothetical protein
MYTKLNVQTGMRIKSVLPSLQLRTVNKKAANAYRTPKDVLNG